MMNSYIKRLNRIEYLVVEVDGFKCLSPKGMFKELALGFNFPATKSKSYGNVTLDLMTDLQWLKHKNIQLIVVNMNKTKKQDQESITEMKNMFNTIQGYWTEKHNRVGNKFENHFNINFVD